MVDIVLVEPEIPNNTGAIARTCACTGSRLHLVKPLGFDISDRAVKRAGLDYWHLVDISVYENIDEYFAKNGDENLWLLTTKASVSYVDADLSTPNVTLMFGKETQGLPEWLRQGLSVAGGIMPAMGMAMLLKMMDFRKFWAFLMVIIALQLDH